MPNFHARDHRRLAPTAFKHRIRKADGNLYGTTYLGGDLTLNGGSGYGTVFELSPVPEPSSLALGLVSVSGLALGPLSRRSQRIG